MGGVRGKFGMILRLATEGGERREEGGQGVAGREGIWKLVGSTGS